VLADGRRAPASAGSAPGAHGEPPSPPSIEAARQALGGRGSTSALAGTFVRVPGAAASTWGAARRGVVVYADAATADVWVGDGRIRRVAVADLAPLPDEPLHPLAPVAADARLFAALREGDAVRAASHDGPPDGRTVVEGTLVEKCRYGALVRRSDGRVLAASIRRVWPARGEPA
jgi:hypothetical protein